MIASAGWDRRSFLKWFPAYPKVTMKLAEKFSAAVRFVFSPGAASYDRWRQLRFVLLAILIASILAVGFGLVLYNLNVNRRM